MLLILWNISLFNHILLNKYLENKNKSKKIQLTFFNILNLEII